MLYSNIGELEYLISFRLHDVNMIGEFEVMYQASNLPQTGVAITYSLFRMLNAITDGILAAVIVLISLLLIIIAALCLRFTLTATIEEDFREIGVMKAISIASHEIRRLYMVKYVAMAYSKCFGLRHSFTCGGSIHGKHNPLYGKCACNHVERHFTFTRRISCIPCRCGLLPLGITQIQKSIRSRSYEGYKHHSHRLWSKKI